MNTSCCIARVGAKTAIKVATLIMGRTWGICHIQWLWAVALACLAFYLGVLRLS
jgi:hypothetical protein